MYSTTPIPDPNLDHTGFLIALIALGLVYCATILIVSETSPERSDYAHNKMSFLESLFKTIRFNVGLLVVCSTSIVVAGYFSFSEKLPVPKNNVVVAKMVGGPSTVIDMTGGKHPRPVSYTHVSYMTPDGIVTFRVLPGQAWPETANLYKN